MDQITPNIIEDKLSRFYLRKDTSYHYFMYAGTEPNSLKQFGFPMEMESDGCVPRQICLFHYNEVVTYHPHVQSQICRKYEKTGKIYQLCSPWIVL